MTAACTDRRGRSTGDAGRAATLRSMGGKSRADGVSDASSERAALLEQVAGYLAWEEELGGSFLPAQSGERSRASMEGSRAESRASMEGSRVESRAGTEPAAVPPQRSPAPRAQVPAPAGASSALEPALSATASPPASPRAEAPQDAQELRRRL